MQVTQDKTYPSACDCHVHIYEDTYPMVPNVAWLPPHLPVSTYREVQKAVGLSRAVIVQPSAYGFVNLQPDGRTMPHHEEVLMRLQCSLVSTTRSSFWRP